MNRLIPGGVGKNAIFLALSAGAKGISSIVFLILAVRALDSDATAELILVFLGIRIIQNVAGAGLGRYLARETAHDPPAAGRLAHEVMKLLAAAAGIMVVASLAVAGVIDARTGLVLALIAAAALAGSAQQALGGAFLGQGKPQGDSVGELLAGGLLVAGGLVAALVDGGAAMFVGVVAVSRVAAFGVLAVLYRYEFGSLLSAQEASLRHAFAAGLPYMINAGASFVFLRVDILLLGALSGANAVLVYGVVADPLVTIGATVHVANTAFLPALSSARADERPHLARRMLTLDLIIGVALAVIVFIGADFFVTEILEQPDSSSVTVLRVLSLTIAMRFVSNGLATCLTAAGHQWRRTAIATAAGVFNVVLNLATIPLWGYWGAVGSTVATETLILGVSMVALRPEWFAGRGYATSVRTAATEGSQFGPD
jgi:O-antigen/teichoic acid export membrane protein